MIFLTFLFFHFMRIKDLKSQRTILKGVFIGWASICVTLIIVTPSSIYFIILTGLASAISFLSSRGFNVVCQEVHFMLFQTLVVQE